MNATKDVHIVLIFFLYDIQNDHNDESWFFDCVTITSTWYLQTLLILHLMFYFHWCSSVIIIIVLYCPIYLCVCLSGIVTCALFCLVWQYTFIPRTYLMLIGFTYYVIFLLKDISSSDNKSVSHWIMFDYIFHV